ncbi:MAG: nucleotidyltransferase domain-containing protein [Clostridia bacterium]|nr:nucleotidyltransferase domain-containing protein [Clostridia bacterium]
MEREWIKGDRVLERIKDLIGTVGEKLGIEIMSLVLFGSRARGDRNSQNDYEILLLTHDNIGLNSYILINDTLKLELLKEKLFRVKVQVYTPETFEKILYNDEITGTFLYMICKECIVLYDKCGTFGQILERISFNSMKDEEVFIKQCIEFARMFGSEKWAQKWEKVLMQHKYIKKRKGY